MTEISVTSSDHDTDERDRERWRVNLTDNTATHDTGLVMLFERDPNTPGAWNGNPTNLDDWQKRQGLPFADLAHCLPRLMRLSGDAFAAARKRGR